MIFATSPSNCSRLHVVTFRCQRCRRSSRRIEPTSRFNTGHHSRVTTGARRAGATMPANRVLNVPLGAGSQSQSCNLRRDSGRRELSRTRLPPWRTATLIDRRNHIGVNITCVVKGKADDLPARIDRAGRRQIQRRVGRDKAVEVAHHALLPDEGRWVELIV